MDERLGASFAIDITALKTGLAQANRLIRESNSEFKAAAAGLDDWTSSEEGLTAKLKNLNDVADIQGKKVSALQEEYDRLISEGTDPLSASMVKLRTDINNEQAAFKRTQSEIERYSEALHDVQEETNSTSSFMSRLKKAFKEAAGAADDTADAAENAGDGFSIAKGAIADFIGNGLSNLVGAAGDAVSSLLGLSESTREFRQDLATLDTAFKSAGLSAEQGTETWKSLYGVFGEDDRAVEAANNIARMSKNQEDLNEWVRITTGVWGTYQDALPVESLAEAAGETAKTGTVTGTLADALNWSSEAAVMFSKYMSEDVTTAEDAFNEALSECTTEAERQALITDTLTKLYGEAADQYRETAGNIIEANEAQAEQNLTMAKFGELVEPITTKVSEGFGRILEKVLELTGNTDVETFAAKVDKAFETFTEETLPDIIDGLQWVVDHKEIILSAIVGIGTGFAIFKGVPAVINAVNTAQMLLNGTMRANPIAIVATLIGGLVTAFTLLWQKSEAFRNFWKGLWDGIKSVTKVAINGLIGMLNGWITGLNALLLPVRGIVYGVAKAFGSDISFGDVRIPKIPYLAKGGVVSKATAAVIGEDGTEAVMPLEKNTEWLDVIADKLASKQQSVVVNQTNNYSQAHSRYELYKSKQQTAAAVRLAMGVR